MFACRELNSTWPHAWYQSQSEATSIPASNSVGAVPNLVEGTENPT
jgi:hypothetical protein